MKKNSRMYFSNIVVLLLLPYLITILINGGSESKGGF